ncbi:OstA-like protein [Ichthyenterobacterium sp. W332]|uniref:OstA-like protein n=1 Tax=Microcosmobacter mediterraneus TaxID=3075607 RepID=A0ABU2YQF5_9FLAO|nr:OstA-like protein [Ichthyenterobacterium sp. W332]MDT0559495.1 OstA-like protein [Ichthyenterobacterium sp. W332]
MKRFTYVLLLTICCSFIYQINAQQKRIYIKYSGFAKSSDNGVQEFIRDDTQQIHFIHEGIDMYCDKAIYYQTEDFVEAYGNVSMKQGDTINMTSKYVEYSGITQLAFARGNVVLREPQSTLTTDTLWMDRAKQQAFYKSKGKVVRDSSGTITSQIGRYYMDRSKYQFVKDVKLVNPEYTIDTNQLDFYTETGHAYLFGPSTIVSETSTIYCERGFYNTNDDTGYFVKKSKINYDNRIVEGDSMYFDRNRSFASATNNIKVTDTINRSIITGHYAEVFREKDSVYITKRALAITVQENDSLYIHGDKLMITGKPEHRITRAYYGVKLYKSDLAGKCDSIHADHKTGLTQLINIERFGTSDPFSTKRKPILWNLGNQMTGDSIHLISNVEKEQLDSLKVFNNAFLISKDTIGDSDGFNQIKGQRLIGLFRDNELYNVDIIKNAEKIYYSRNDDNELVGINKSKSGSINIQIEDNTITIISLLKQIDGDIFPESEFPKNARQFRGFDWRDEERPKSVEDLFRGEPPLKLPVIKGLDEYVPQAEFFDDELMARMELSKKKVFIEKYSKENQTFEKPTKIKTREISKNLLKEIDNFKHKVWQKYDVKLIQTQIKAPDNISVDYLIKRKGERDFGYIGQNTNEIEGNYKFTVWLKGKGSVLINLQEGAGDYTRYNFTSVKLSNTWQEYAVEGKKDSDNNPLRITISNIDNNEEIYIWEPKLVKIKQ